MEEKASACSVRNDGAGQDGGGEGGQRRQRALRDEGGAGAVVETVDGEIAAVDGEDFA